MSSENVDNCCLFLLVSFFRGMLPSLKNAVVFEESRKAVTALIANRSCLQATEHTFRVLVHLLLLLDSRNFNNFSW